MLLQDRKDAGKKLAAMLNRYAGAKGMIVLGLPRGGVPVAYEVAVALGLPLDVFIVRKLGFPEHEELAMGAIASGNVLILNQELLDEIGVQDEIIEMVARREREELRRREELYRRGRPPLCLSNRGVIIVDDGLATGASMRAAVAAVRQHNPKETIVAVPLAAAEVCAEFSRIADKMFCYATPEPFWAVGYWYKDFEQTTDSEVQSLLDIAARSSAA